MTAMPDPVAGTHSEKTAEAAGDSQRRVQMTITPEMVEAGMAAFHSSGFDEYESPSNEPLIRRILEASISRSSEVCLKKR